MRIDLRSDTVTKPTPNMLHAMMKAEVGDDVFMEDPNVLALEYKTAQMFGKEAGLFCPSGTMTNQVAIKVHTQPGDEVIIDKNSHIYYYEGGGIAFNSGASVKLVDGDRGRITAEDVLARINPDDVHFPVTKVVAVENTSNRGGGCCYDMEELKRINKVCKENNLVLHLDGARVFNALVRQNIPAAEMGQLFDSISVCLSKGLGAPVGSVLLGAKEMIRKARRVRKVLGGGMRQAGYLAAAGIYALDNHISRLSQDHGRAQLLAEVLRNASYVREVLPVETNIIFFKMADGLLGADLVNYLATKDILCLSLDKQTVRIVTHLDFNDVMLGRVVDALEGFKA